MSGLPREKIALLVFSGLIALSLCGLGWYLLAGHSWNVAASNIDDTFGSMDGYTALLYQGTAAPEEDAPASADGKAAAAEGAGVSPGSPSSRGGADGPSSQPGGLADGGPAGSSAALGEADGSKGGGASAGDLPHDAASASEDSASGIAASEALERLSDSDSSPFSRFSASVDDEPALTVAEAAQSYEDKRATVFSFNVEHPEKYREGLTLKKNGRRLGVCSVDGPLSAPALVKQVKAFDRQKVDFIVVITPDRRYVDGIPGIDIVISTRDEGLFAMGETIDGTFYVDAPPVGHVGAILISPSNVVSAKDIERL